MKNIYKGIIGLAIGGMAYGASTVPITIETIPARQITTSGEGCFELLTDNSVSDISKNEYDSFALKGARPVKKAWCGTKFDTLERQPKKGDYWDDINGRMVWAKNKPSLLSKETDVEIVGNEIKITKPFYETIINNAEAAISYQNKGGSSGSGVTSLTTAFDVGSGSNRLISVQVQTYDSEGTTDCQVTGITYAGTGLAQAVEQAGIAGTNNWTETWHLANPTSGSNNVVTTFAGNCTAPVHTFIALNGAKQTGQPDATNGGTCNTTANCSATITTINDNSWTISAVNTEVCGTFTLSGATIGTTIGGCVGDGYSGPKTPAGAVSHDWGDGSASERWTWTAVSYQPDVSAGASPSITSDTIFFD